MKFSSEQIEAVRRFIELDNRRRDLNAVLKDLKGELSVLGESILATMEECGVGSLACNGMTVGTKKRKRLELGADDGVIKERLATFNRFDCMILSHPRLSSLLTTKKASEEALDEDLARLFTVVESVVPTVRTSRAGDTPMEDADNTQTDMFEGTQ